jgi:hypothetical protein
VRLYLTKGWSNLSIAKEGRREGREKEKKEKMEKKDKLGHRLTQTKKKNHVKTQWEGHLQGMESALRRHQSHCQRTKS